MAASPPIVRAVRAVGETAAAASWRSPGRKRARARALALARALARARALALALNLNRNPSPSPNPSPNQEAGPASDLKADAVFDCRGLRPNNERSYGVRP